MFEVSITISVLPFELFLIASDEKVKLTFIYRNLGDFMLPLICRNLLLLSIIY